MSRQELPHLFAAPHTRGIVRERRQTPRPDLPEQLLEGRSREDGPPDPRLPGRLSRACRSRRLLRQREWKVEPNDGFECINACGGTSRVRGANVCRDRVQLAARVQCLDWYGSNQSQCPMSSVPASTFGNRKFQQPSAAPSSIVIAPSAQQSPSTLLSFPTGIGTPESMRAAMTVGTCVCRV